MNKMKYNLLLYGLLGFAFWACQKGEGETVETANILRPQADIPYTFSRNGQSSVDEHTVALLREPLDIIERRLLSGAISDFTYTEILRYYTEGTSYVKPIDEIASSSLVPTDRIKEDIINLFLSAKNIPLREAHPGISGDAGRRVGDAERVYVDEKGIAPAQVFMRVIDGAIYLDKILLLHLDERYFSDTTLRRNHQNVILPPGENYTELEHHWDLAYGYFLHLQSLTQSDGVAALAGVERKIRNAFVQGRIELGRYRYEALYTQMRIIREELSKAIAIRAINTLTGVITLTNYTEAPKQAFKYLSQGYGFLYALQFTRRADGTLYFTYDEVRALQNQLIAGIGLWDVTRLLAPTVQEGSLKNITQQIAERYQL
ncbi:DUF4856 domain-containing protein [Capnocytophaga sp. oral taxon 338]|jgi:hypothetical protein|uniref:DUF4856 domain-containing protein n=1 Tax=Capnocytophaga sp. oral taxon 338 TaxID=710239 RepID=UPI000202B345|nr:hypothetical protein HMPREF9071_1921 [Capnocytophaga sp. oral taxon 338 str. F0234]